MIIDVERTCFSITNVGVEFRVSIYNKWTPEKIGVSREVVKKSIVDEYGEVLLKEKCERDSIRRARKAVVDYALCNQFDFFGTITLDDKKVGAENVTDYCFMAEKLSKALDNYRQLYAKNLEYLFVPELGENTGRLHFHFLVKGIDKTHLYRNEYNKLDWHYFRSRFGFINIKPIKKSNTDRMAVARYCAKYITKNAVKLGRMRYFCSKTLDKPVKEVCEDSFTAFLIKEFLESSGYVSYIKNENVAKYVDCFAVPIRVFKDLQEYLTRAHLFDFIHFDYGDKGYEKIYTTRELKTRDPRMYGTFLSKVDPFTQPWAFENKHKAVCFFEQMSV